LCVQTAAEITDTLVPFGIKMMSETLCKAKFRGDGLGQGVYRRVINSWFI